MIRDSSCSLEQLIEVALMESPFTLPDWVLQCYQRPAEIRKSKALPISARDSVGLALTHESELYSCSLLPPTLTVKSLNGTSVENDLPWDCGRGFGSLSCVNLWPNPSEQGGGSSTTPGEDGDGANCGVRAPSIKCCCFQPLLLYWAHWFYLLLHIYCTFYLLNYL